jgi:putative glutamine amidotransferase
MGSVLPIVGISCDRRVSSRHPFHMVGEKYITAMRDGAGVLPLLVPALLPPLPPDYILAHVDGLLFTGSPSNVAPHLYGGHDPRDVSLLDEARDATALPLLRAGVAAGVPVLCICRGFQELNVAFGGSLHQHLHEVKGFADHREREAAPPDEQYGPAHDIRIVPGGLLQEIAPDLAAASDLRVNSLHSQGIDRLASVLRIEAEAPDGAIEAVSMEEAEGFLLGVQWHPEWRFARDPLSRALFAAFGDAVRAHARAAHHTGDVA